MTCLFDHLIQLACLDEERDVLLLLPLPTAVDASKQSVGARQTVYTFTELVGGEYSLVRSLFIVHLHPPIEDPKLPASRH